MLRSLFLLLAAVNFSLSRSTFPIQLHLSKPTNPVTLASYTIEIDVFLTYSHDYLFDELFSKYQICLVFSDLRNQCHEIKKLAYTYLISFDHQVKESHIQISLCNLGINFEQCQQDSFSSIELTLQAPNMNIAKELWPLFVPSEEFYWHKIAILFGSFDFEDLQRLVGVSNHLHIITSSSSLDLCQSNLTAIFYQCCHLSQSFHQCLPPVADLGIILLTRETLTSSPHLNQHLTSTISLINGRVLFLSSDLTFFEILDYLSPLLLRAFSFQTIPKKLISVQKYYQTVFLVDVSSFWMQRNSISSFSSQPSLRSFESIPSPTEINVSLSYGLETILLKNVCLFDKNTLIILPSAPASSSASTISAENLDFFRRRFPQWKFLLSDDERMSLNSSTLVTWISGSSLAAIPPYAHSISHLIQTLLPLFHHLHLPPPDHWIYQLIDTFSSFYFLFPTIGRDDFQWNLQFVSLLRSFMKHHLLFLRGAQETVYQGDSQNLQEKEDLDLFGPKILFAEDIKAMTQPQSNTSFRFNVHRDPKQTPADDDTLICFENLVILSPATLSTPYFNHLHEAKAFTRYAYDWVDDTMLPTHHHQFSSYFDPMVFDRPVSNPDSASFSESHRSQSLDTSPKNLTPNDGLKVTLVTRPHNRRVTNIHHLIQTLLSSGLVDLKWFMNSGGQSTNGIYFEILSFQQQISLMKNTDVLILTHGSGVTNSIFLQESSAVIEILTSPWYQLAVLGNCAIMNIYYYHIIQTNLNSIKNCDLKIVQECSEKNPSILKRGHCLPIRQCDTYVDMEAFEIIFTQAAHQVRIMKRNIFQSRRDLEQNSDQRIHLTDPMEIIQWKNQQYSYRDGMKIPLG
jgi:hypothetical protein